MIMEKDEDDDPKQVRAAKANQQSPYDAQEIRKLNPYDYTKEIMKELNDQKIQESKT